MIQATLPDSHLTLIISGSMLRSVKGERHTSISVNVRYTQSSPSDSGERSSCHLLHGRALDDEEVEESSSCLDKTPI